MSESAETVTATPTPVESTPAPSVRLADLTPTQYDKWRGTGELPTAEPETSPSSDAAALETKPGEYTAPSAEKAPVEPQTTKPHKARDDHQVRISQALEQKKAADARAEAAERRAADLEARLSSQTPKPASPNAPPDPAPPSAKPTIAERLANPLDYPAIDDDTQFWMEYPDASVSQMTKYFGAYEAEARFAARERKLAETELTRKAEASVDRAIQDGQAKYPDWDVTPLAGAIVGPSGPIISQLLFESPLSVELLYHLSKNPAEARSLAAMEPLAAAHALGKLESRLSTPAPSRIAAPTKTVSSAPDPPQTLGARHTPNAGDEVEQAIRDKDTGRYIEAENRRELAAMKAGRR